MQRIHFMGIGGRGISGVVMMAQKAGYIVSGCDRDTDNPYVDELRAHNIQVTTGHDKSHMTESDLLVVSPALLVQQPLHEEITHAKHVISWQQFLADYLQKNKHVICIAGTHGKSTTTAMAALLFEQTGLDPTVMIGATIPEWHENYRIGQSDIHITESDEYHDNFHYYTPETIILNNIELDHPDYFKTEEQLFASFQKHISHLTGKKQLIVNLDDAGNRALMALCMKEELSHISVYGYCSSNERTHTFDLSDSLRSIIKEENLFCAENIIQTPMGTTFTVNGKNFSLQLPGLFNVSNALGVILLAHLYDIDMAKVQESLATFTGIGMRLEHIGEYQGIIFYDDYAHHPTAVRETLAALRQRYPTNRIIALVQPDSFSRTKTFLRQYTHAFDSADEVIIAPISPARDREDFGLSNHSVVAVTDHPHIQAIDSFPEIIEYIKTHATRGDIVIAMCGGGGQIHTTIRDIAERMKNT